jgi:hypothetical protein
MWPSYETASSIYDKANIALVLGLVIGVLATALIVWMGNVKEEYLKLNVGAANAAAEKARADAANANEQAAGANERAANVEKHNLELQTTLERERSARLKLEAQIAPRSLATAQREALGKALSSAPKPLTVELMLLGDQEAGMYGEQILSALQDAKIQVKPFKVGVYTPPPYGIQITLQANSAKSLSIKNAFEKANVPATFSFENTGQFDAKILVGLKPIQ